MHSRYHRTVTILWWSIPFLILPILTLCVVTQMTAVKTVTIETSRHKQQVEIESEFNREVKLDAEKAENQAFIKDLRSAIK
jgi:heme/copper-type cytochrome/quinol oxidase subunit 2